LDNLGVLFTYGITGSGKTYTMMGPLNNPGLIPRSFDVIFNSIGPYLGKKYVSFISLFCSYSINITEFQLLRSDRQNGYEIQNDADILIERQRKEIQMPKNTNTQRGK
jgi:kinesin family protein 23